MRGLPFRPTTDATASLRAAARAAAVAFVAECRAIAEMHEQARPEHREFVHGEVACVLHLSPVTAGKRLATALAVMQRPRLVSALEQAEIGVPHALSLLAEIEHLDGAHADQVLATVLGDNAQTPVEATPGELRGAAKRAAIVCDPAVTRARREAAKRTAGVHGRPGVDGMGQVVIDCTAVEMARALAAIDGRVSAMAFDQPDLTVGQQRVAAFLHAVGCERTNVQAVLECPVERAVDLHALGRAPVWTVDVRMPVAVALGLSDHPALLSGYGPIDADQARALLPAADLVRACVDAVTGEVLTVDPPIRARTWRRADTTRAAALRRTLVAMAASGGTVPDLSADGYVPSEALGRLVDLRDVTCTFPGNATRTRRTDRDHRLPWPLGRTTDNNLQNVARRWHRAKHTGWHTELLADGRIRWTSPRGHSYDRRPRRTRPPDIPPDARLPPLPPDPPPDSS